MKKILFTACLTAMTAAIFAQVKEQISVEPLTIPQGKKAEMVVNFQFNANHQYVSYQFTVELPSGLSLVEEEYGKAAYTLADNQPASVFNVDFPVSNGILKVYSNPSTYINGTSGELVRIPVKASDDLAVGTELTAKLSAVEFTWNTGAVRTVFDDAEASITVGEPRIVFDEEAVSLPFYDDGETSDVTLKRTLKKDIWNTIVLPFPVSKANLATAFGDGAQYAQFANDFEIEYEDDDITARAITLKFSTVNTTRAGLSAQKPYLVKPASDITSFSLDGVKLSTTPTPDTKDDSEGYSSGSFTGTFVKTNVPTDCVFLSNETFFYSTGATVIKGFRAWFDLQAVVGKEVSVEANMLRFIVDDSEATGISTAGSSKSKVQSCYDLQGRRMTSGKRGKGIYIMNNKKVVVR